MAAADTNSMSGPIDAYVRLAEFKASTFDTRPNGMIPITELGDLMRTLDLNPTCEELLELLQELPHQRNLDFGSFIALLPRWRTMVLEGEIAANVHRDLAGVTDLQNRAAIEYYTETLKMDPYDAMWRIGCLRTKFNKACHRLNDDNFDGYRVTLSNKKWKVSNIVEEDFACFVFVRGQGVNFGDIMILRSKFSNFSLLKRGILERLCEDKVITDAELLTKENELNLSYDDVSTSSMRPLVTQAEFTGMCSIGGDIKITVAF